MRAAKVQAPCCASTIVAAHLAHVLLRGVGVAAAATAAAGKAAVAAIEHSWC